MSGKKFMSFLLVSFLWMACAEEKTPQQNPQQVPHPKAGGETTQPPSTQSPSKAECTITFPKSGLCLSWSWEKRPMSTADRGILIFKTYRLNPDQTPLAVDLKNPRVVPWMPGGGGCCGGGGHGSTERAQTTPVDVGVYRTSNVLFTMAGTWKLHFKESSDYGETTDEVQVELTVF